MVTLENEFLKVNISSQGAEMTSIFSKKTNTEYLWQGDPNIWGWHAPNLFPVVGGSLNNEIQVDGKAYPMARHGFARNSKFRRIESTPVHVKFALHYSAETYAIYPYKFEFQVLYDLTGSNIRVSYKVLNLDKETIYFSVGAHPAFNVPFNSDEAYDDYYIEFERDQQLDTHSLSSDGYFTGKTSPVALNANKLNLTKTLFDKDALVFKKLQSRKVFLKSINHSKSICLSYKHFNYLGIWAKPGAPFVCIEPWLGAADTAGKITDIKGKEDIQQVEHGHVFENEFVIGITD